MADFAFQFAWDTEKATANRAKHGVTFELAATVFRDELALSLFDEDHGDEIGDHALEGVPGKGLPPGESRLPEKNRAEQRHETDEHTQ